MFVETFLESKNQDCLEQVLSFLTCNDLSGVAVTAKTLHRTIFEDDKVENKINSIWQGAEQALTNRSDRQEGVQLRTSFGSNARERCRLFVLASKAAMAFESSDEVAENRMMVGDVLGNLLNVREFDAESVAEKLAIGAKETKTLEEAVSECKITMTPLSNEADAATLHHEEKWKKLAELTPPEKSNSHEIFVRITRASTGKVVSQGFCDYEQKLPWYAGLEMQRDFAFDYPDVKQGLQIFMDFESLKQSEEMQSFQQQYVESEGRFNTEVKSDFIMTAVAIDKQDYSVSCLFQHGQENSQYSALDIRLALGSLRGMDSYCFNLNARWGHDHLQLGSSMFNDRYYLSYSLSLNMLPLSNSSCHFLPSLNVDVQRDRSLAMLAIHTRFLPPGARAIRTSSNF